VTRDDEVVSIEHSLRWQRDYVLDMGSAVAGLVLEAALVSANIRTMLPENVRFGSLPGLRWMAAVHRLAIERLAPGVALHLPTLGGSPPSDVGRERFLEAIETAALSNPSVVSQYLAHVPQTNEPSRAAVLRCALSRLDPELPVRLFEFGCSAGLNLRADVLPGIPELEAGPLPAIVERVGCDLDPVDANSPDGRALLSSYVWVDDVDRWASLQHALDIASSVPVVVKKQEAREFVCQIEPRPGCATVLWQSAMWIYLDEAKRREVLSAIDDVAARATPESPVIHISWEWHERQEEGPFELVLTRWDGRPDSGVPAVIATGTSHGTSVTLR